MGVAVRSSANQLLETASAVPKGRLIAVLLSGLGSDATDGVQTMRAHGGLVMAQVEIAHDRATSQWGGMPGAAVAPGAVDQPLSPAAIGPALVALVAGQAT